MGSQQLWNGMGYQRYVNVQPQQQQLGNGMSHQCSTFNGQSTGWAITQVISLKTGSMRRTGKDTVSYSPISNKTAPPSLFKTLTKTLMVPHPRVQQAPDPSDHSLNIPMANNNNNHKPHLAAKSSVNLVTGLIDLQRRPYTRPTNPTPPLPARCSTSLLARGRLQGRGGRTHRRRR
jgi:hypothetical protein